MASASRLNTLEYDPELCTRCGMCSVVCPHRVFASGNGEAARLSDPDSCMECGACALNCEPGAIKVDSDVGCASAMIIAALTGRKDAACCG
jgi:NAD-dependent dihydropyrimidine dehydrogenase PreA subunit